MDRLLYTTMSGAKQIMRAQVSNTNNLANANTTGFRSDFESMRSMPVFGEGMPTRVYAMAERPGINFQHGSLETTSRDLDVAVRGEGWLAIEGADGEEAYTRAGNLQVTSLGQLVTANGHPVIGNGGAIALPPYKKLEIAQDGTISIIPLEGGNNELAVVDRIKLVNPDLATLKKGEDGLLRLKEGGISPFDAKVSVIGGALEMSNVNAISEMVDMISLSRQFEAQWKLMKKAEELDSSTTQLLKINS